MGTVAEPIRDDQLRASDADREKVAERLRQAQAEGRLDLAEFDERVAAAWAARTYGELTPLTADLPGGAVALSADAARQPVRQTAAERRPARDGHQHRSAVAAWLSVSLINVVIWGVISLATWHWVYPWWIWVAGPWGAVILAGWIGSRVVRS